MILKTIIKMFHEVRKWKLKRRNLKERVKE